MAKTLNDYLGGSLPTKEVLRGAAKRLVGELDTVLGSYYSGTGTYPAKEVAKINGLLAKVGEASREVSAGLDAQLPRSKDKKSSWDQRVAAAWASDILSDPDGYVVLDTETTGVSEDDEVVEIAVLDMGGAKLFNQRLRPSIPMPAEASEVNGIYDADLAGCPGYADVAAELAAAIGGRLIVAYNAGYDLRLLDQTYCRHGGYRPPPPTRWRCVMLEYARWWGAWDAEKERYKWQRLEEHSTSADHSAAGDCVATIELLGKMGKGVKV